MSKWEVFTGVWMAIALFLILLFTTVVKKHLVSKSEAVKAGVAEYYLDAEHQRQFRWKTNSARRFEDLTQDQMLNWTNLVDPRN